MITSDAELSARQGLASSADRLRLIQVLSVVAVELLNGPRPYRLEYGTISLRV